MRSRKRWIVVALTMGLLLTSLGAFSALALTRSPKAVADCGTPAVGTIPCVVSGHHDAVVQLSGQTRIAGLRVRAGNWFFIAKVVVASTLGGPDTVACTLSAETSVDTSKVVLPPGQSNTASMTLVHTFAARGDAFVSCDGVAGESANSLRITAIRAGTLFDQGIV
jgi:hypothetical protein